MPKTDLIFRSSLINAEGTLGFAPDVRNTPGYHQLGAFITNPVSLSPRSPADNRAAVSYPGGVLLHSGYPNPGLVKSLRNYDKAWSGAPMPVILHLLVEDMAGMETCLRVLEGMNSLTGLELSLQPGTPARDAAGILQVAKQEWPIIAQLGEEELDGILQLIESSGITAISMSPIRGVLRKKPGLDEVVKVSGRLFGPALYPQTLRRLERFVKFGVPVIAGGGIENRVQIAQILQAGALAVKLDTVFWTNPINFPD